MLRSMSVVVAGLACGVVQAEEFTLQIASPVAAQSSPGGHVKGAAFVLRAQGCVESAKLDVTGAAEGLVKGERLSVPLKRILSLPTRGVYAINREWPGEGVWVAHITARCGSSIAAALVVPGNNGPARESSKLFTRAATEADISALLKTLTVAAGADVVAHEWGTFTSVASEDGRSVRWAPLLGPADLPCFVNRVAGINPKGMGGLVRMETPVLYFYSPRPITLSVRVAFPQGMITEWYPKASSSGSIAQIAWDRVEVLPGETPQLPTSKNANHYFAARETDAAPLRIGDQWEKLLFYRGMGDFEVPLRPSLTAEGRLLIRNAARETIPLGIVFENRGGKVGYRLARSIRDTAELELPELTGKLEDLRSLLVENLVEFGLYRKEALAMVETWRESWFEEGMRVFYIVPRSTVDSVLPLNIAPAPKATARVFVGRVELLSPAMQTSIGAALSSNDTATLMTYGRFLEPFIAQMERTGGKRLMSAARSQAFGKLAEQRFNGPQCVE